MQRTGRLVGWNIDIRSEEELKKSDEAKNRAVADAEKAIAQAGQSDWGPRAKRLLYMVQQGIPTYGNGQ